MCGLTSQNYLKAVNVTKKFDNSTVFIDQIEAECTLAAFSGAFFVLVRKKP